MSIRVNRRNVLSAAAAGVVWTGFPLRPAQAAPGKFQRIMGEKFGGKPITEAKVIFDMSDISENGNSVLVGVFAESPMTQTDYVKTIYLFAEENPFPEVISFHFTPMSGKADVTTRIRLAKSQSVIAVAEMNDGSLYSAKKFVKVTIGGCGGSN